jgi:hypothetical protein
MSCYEAGLHQINRPDRARAVPGTKGARSDLSTAGFQVYETTTHIPDHQIQIAVAVKITGSGRGESRYLRQPDIGALELWGLRIPNVEEQL